MPSFHARKLGKEALQAQLVAAVDAFPVKYLWFAQHGYLPHAYQILFHGSRHGDILTRFRHLAAGRRGGKTLSAAWEVAFYALHPRQFHLDAHGTENDDPLWIYVVSPDYKIGRASLITFLGVLRKLGLVKGKDYEYNKTEKIIEFPDGTLIEFRTAVDPESLRGAGLDILWFDEAAMFTDARAWNVVRPAIGDKVGLFISTTTPQGQNWFYEEFWNKKALADPFQFRIEYWSLDNPHFPREVWAYEREHMHPFLFRQEYMADFQALHGIELRADWLRYFVVGTTSVVTPDDIRLDPKRPLKRYMAVDPAISIRDDADDFAMALIGVEEDNSQAYLLKTFRGHIPFPEQVELVQEWFHTYQPQIIGVESNAYQAALVQQLMRLPGLPNIVPIFSKGKKEERIMAMAPLFKSGRIRIPRYGSHDFLDQWVSWDSTKKKIRDDILDAVEIAIGLAGVLLPRAFAKADPLADLRPPSSLEEAAARELAALDALGNRRGNPPIDPELGGFY